MSNNRRDKKSTVNSLKKIAGQLNTEGVPKILKIESLVDHPDNDYVFGMEESDIKNMAEGIKQNGFRGAIEVWDLKNGKYMIYSGHVRKEGVVYNGGDEIRSFVYDYPDSETVRRRLFLGANIYGRNKLDINDPIHTARQVAYHRETLKKEGINKDLRSILAGEFGVSESNIQRYESILNLTPEIQEKTETGELPITVAAAMGSMDEETQEETVKGIEGLVQKFGKDAITRNDMTQIIKEVKKTGDVEGAVEKTAIKIKEKNTQDDENEVIIEEELKEETVSPFPMVETAVINNDDELPKKEQWNPSIEDDEEIMYDDFLDEEENIVEEENNNDKIMIEASEKMMNALAANYQYTDTKKVLRELENTKILIEKEISRLHKQ